MSNFNRSTRPRWLEHYYNNFRTGILSVRVLRERIVYLFTRLNSRSSVRIWQTDLLFPLSYFVEWSLPFVSLCTSNYLSTSSPLLFLSLHPISPYFSLSIPITLSLRGIINIAVRCRYLHNPVDSISGFSCTERNRTEPNRARMVLRQRRRIQQEWFLFSAILVSVSASVRAADFIGAAATACMSIYSIAVH